MADEPLIPDDYSPAATLANRFLHRLDQQSNGYCGDDELKQLLQPYIMQPGGFSQAA